MFSVAFADAAVAPIDFPIAPAYAMPRVSSQDDLTHHNLLSLVQKDDTIIPAQNMSILIQK